MASINERVPEDISFGKRGVQTREDFVATQEAGQDKLAGEFAPKINTMAEEMNVVSADLTTRSNDVVTRHNDIINKTSTATTASNTAVAAKDEIQSYVIPTEATYNPQLIDSKINALMPNSGYTQVSKKLDNFVFQTDANFTYSVADKNRFVKFGDKVVDTYGPELVTNGDLYIHQNSDVSITDDIVSVENITTYKAWVSENYPTTIGKNYLINVGHVDGTFRIYIGNSNGSGDILIGEYGVYELIFKATSPTTYLTIENISSTTGVSFSYLDNISVKEIQTADFSNDIPDVAEVITDGSNTTSVAVNAGDYVVDGSELSETATTTTTGANSFQYTGVHSFSVGDKVIFKDITNSTTIYGIAYVETIVEGLYIALASDTIGTNISYNRVAGNVYSIKRISDTFRASRNTADMYDLDDTETTSQTKYAGEVIYCTGTNPNGIAGHFYKVLAATTTAPTSTTDLAAYYLDLGTASSMSLENPYFEDRTEIGVTNQVLSYHAYNTLTKAYEGIKTEVLFSDVSKIELLNNDTWMSANGFSKISQFLYSKGVYQVLPIGIWQSLNKGAYHPVFNGFGTADIASLTSGFVSNWYGLNDSGSIRDVSNVYNTATCFSEAHLTANGSIDGAGISHPQSKFYDIVYPDQFIDVRQYAKIATPYEIELIRKDKEENGVEEVVSIYKSYVGTASSGGILATDRTYVYLGTGNVLNLSTSDTNLFSEDEFTITLWNMTKGNVYDCLSVRWVSANNGNVVYIYGDVTAEFDTSDEIIMKIVSTKPILSSSTKLSIDLIGNPQFYPQVLKDRLASGVGVVGVNPLLVEA